MAKMTVRSIPVGFTLALGVAAAWIGLGSGCNTVSGVSVCEQWCECQGCSATERQECEASFATGEKLSTDKGCTDLYDTFLGCISDHMQCVADEVDIDACEPERKAMKKCTGGPCEDLAAAQLSCCEKVSDKTTRDACTSSVEAQPLDELSDAACEAVKQAFSCPL